MVEIYPCVVSEGSHKQGGAWKDKEGVKPARRVLRSVEAIRKATLCAGAGPPLEDMPRDTAASVRRWKGAAVDAACGQAHRLSGSITAAVCAGSARVGNWAPCYRGKPFAAGKALGGVTCKRGAQLGHAMLGCERANRPRWHGQALLPRVL